MANRMNKYSLRNDAMGGEQRNNKDVEEIPNESVSASSSTKKDDPQTERNDIPPSIFKEINNGLNDPSDLQNFLRTDKPMGSFTGFFLSLCLEPPRMKQERVIMIAEAYALFAALFLNGVWFIWEYGNSKEFESEALHRVFEAVCALDMIATILVSMFGCFLWMMSIIFSHNQKTWAYGARRWLAGIQSLISIIGFGTLSGLSIALYNRMQGTVEAYVLVAFALLYGFSLLYENSVIMAEQIPLELYHFPFYAKLLFLPHLWFPKKDQIKKAAAARAQELKQLTSKREKELKQKTRGIDELRDLLIGACEKLGKAGTDVSPYLEKLQEDWYDNVDHLRGEDADALSKYMPRVLAKTLLEILNTY